MLSVATNANLTIKLGPSPATMAEHTTLTARSGIAMAYARNGKVSLTARSGVNVVTARSGQQSLHVRDGHTTIALE